MTLNVDALCFSTKINFYGFSYLLFNDTRTIKKFLRSKMELEGD